MGPQVGVDPKLMGIGPAFAIPVALEKVQLFLVKKGGKRFLMVRRAC